MPGRVLCLRGLADVFSLGMNTLAGRLREEGIPALATNGRNWRALADDLEQDARQHRRVHPIVLVGHSYGADNAIRLAGRLRQAKVHVDLLVLLDATNPEAIPPNVARCVHFYRPTPLGDLLPWLFAGHPVETADGNSRTRLSNRRLTRDDLGTAVTGVHHFNVDTSDAVQQLMMNEILPLFARSRPGRYDHAFDTSPSANENASCVISHP